MIPSRVSGALANGSVQFIVGGPGTGKTSIDAVSVVRRHLDALLRVLCVGPTVRARQNLTRVLYTAFGDRVRVIGASQLDALESNLTLSALVAVTMAKDIRSMGRLSTDLHDIVHRVVELLSSSNTPGACSLLQLSLIHI